MVNKAILLGRLGKDPEVRYTPGGEMITSFSIATDESWKNKDGEQVKKTEWHNITTFGKLAEICGKYLTKGKLVYIEGKIQTDSWEKDGVKKYATKIIANTMKMLGDKEDRGEPSSGNEPDDVPF
jgi:single-strand DNA-binding protein